MPWASYQYHVETDASVVPFSKASAGVDHELTSG
jgi:hypothetical protein